MKYAPLTLLFTALTATPAMANDLESYAQKAKEKASEVAGDVSDWSKEKYQDAKEVGQVRMRRQSSL